MSATLWGVLYCCVDMMKNYTEREKKREAESVHKT
jgi:hypothetical protein